MLNLDYLYGHSFSSHNAIRPYLKQAEIVIRVMTEITNIRYNLMDKEKAPRRILFCYSIIDRITGRPDWSSCHPAYYIKNLI